jgi:hypothetical protein
MALYSSYSTGEMRGLYGNTTGEKSVLYRIIHHTWVLFLCACSFLQRDKKEREYFYYVNLQESLWEIA